MQLIVNRRRYKKTVICREVALQKNVCQVWPSAGRLAKQQGQPERKAERPETRAPCSAAFLIWTQGSRCKCAMQPWEWRTMSSPRAT